MAHRGKLKAATQHRCAGNVFPSTTKDTSQYARRKNCCRTIQEQRARPRSPRTTLRVHCPPSPSPVLNDAFNPPSSSSAPPQKKTQEKALHLPVLAQSNREPAFSPCSRTKRSCQGHMKRCTLRYRFQRILERR